MASKPVFLYRQAFLRDPETTALLAVGEPVGEPRPWCPGGGESDGGYKLSDLGYGKTRSLINYYQISQPYIDGWTEIEYYTGEDLSEGLEHLYKNAKKGLLQKVGIKYGVGHAILAKKNHFRNQQLCPSSNRST
jgi:hypothetical protein